MKQSKKPYEPDPLELKNRRRKRRSRERRIKWLLVILTILVILMIAVIFRRIALQRMDNRFKAPLENPTYWYEQTQDVLFLTATPTVTATFTATVPTPTLTPTETFTPTLSPTPTMTPTPKLRPRKTLEGDAADLIAQAEKTLVAVRHRNGTDQYSESWFELLGKPVPFDASEVYPNADCTWAGVAGSIIDKRGEPQVGFYVQAGTGDTLLVETMSGLFPEYGGGGYEITLSRPVRFFDEMLWIRIMDEHHLPASEKVYFLPNGNCDSSLAIINFQRIK